MKKIVNIFMLLAVLVTLFGCGTIIEPPVKTEPIKPTDSPTAVETKPTNSTDGTDPKDIEFKVTIIYNKKPFNQSVNDRDKIEAGDFKVIWTNGFQQVSADITEECTATTSGLDGEFHVYLEKVPDGYSYNPNIYEASNENPEIEIELFRTNTTKKGSGTALYNEYQISNDGFYKANITSAKKKVFYEYQPKKAGYYVIESHVNIYEDTITPYIDLYDGTVAWKEETPDTWPNKDKHLGAYLNGGYTRNFKYVVKIAEQQLSGVFTFSVYAKSKIDVFPVYVDFKISYEGEHYLIEPTSTERLPQEALIQTPNKAEMINMTTSIKSELIRFKFASHADSEDIDNDLTDDKIYFEFILPEKYIETYLPNNGSELEDDDPDDENIYYVAEFRVGEQLNSNNQTIDNIFTYQEPYDIVDSTLSDGVIKQLIISCEIKFNDDGTGTYSVQNYYKEFHVNEEIKSVLLIEDTQNFNYSIDASSKTYQLTNSNGGTGNYYEEGTFNGTQIIDGSDYKYDPYSGYWRCYNAETDTFGAYLVVYITASCPYYTLDQGSLNVIESWGNKALTVQNVYSKNQEWLNHKKFIENYYASICNGDGVCFVTQEMKEFLQLFSVSQRLFMDGNGFVESYTGVYATEDDQWLFACAYSEEI